MVLPEYKLGLIPASPQARYDGWMENADFVMLVAGSIAQVLAINDANKEKRRLTPHELAGALIAVVVLVRALGNV